MAAGGRHYSDDFYYCCTAVGWNIHGNYTNDKISEMRNRIWKALIDENKPDLLLVQEYKDPNRNILMDHLKNGEHRRSGRINSVNRGNNRYESVILWHSNPTNPRFNIFEWYENSTYSELDINEITELYNELARENRLQLPVQNALIALDFEERGCLSILNPRDSNVFILLCSYHGRHHLNEDLRQITDSKPFWFQIFLSFVESAADALANGNLIVVSDTNLSHGEVLIALHSKWNNEKRVGAEKFVIVAHAEIDVVIYKSPQKEFRIPTPVYYKDNRKLTAEILTEDEKQSYPLNYIINHRPVVFEIWIASNRRVNLPDSDSDYEEQANDVMERIAKLHFRNEHSRNKSRRLKAYASGGNNGDYERNEAGSSRRPSSVPHRSRTEASGRTGYSVYVGNLSYRTTGNDLGDFFSQVGNVIKVRIMYDRNTGRPRGFAFCEFETEQEAQCAIDILDRSNFNGRSIRVNWDRSH